MAFVENTDPELLPWAKGTYSHQTHLQSPGEEKNGIFQPPPSLLLASTHTHNFLKCKE